MCCCSHCGGFYEEYLLCCLSLSVISCFLTEEEGVGSFTTIFFFILLLCGCHLSVSPPGGHVGWSEVRICGISCSHSIAFTCQKACQSIWIPHMKNEMLH